MPQPYGDVDDWEEHFNYLVRFFHDTRYIKINSKPMLLIYKSKDIPKFDEMINFWNELAISHGFDDGLHIVETMGGSNQNLLL